MPGSSKTHALSDPLLRIFLDPNRIPARNRGLDRVRFETREDHRDAAVSGVQQAGHRPAYPKQISRLVQKQD